MKTKFITNITKIFIVLQETLKNTCLISKEEGKIMQYYFRFWVNVKYCVYRGGSWHLYFFYVQTYTCHYVWSLTVFMLHSTHLAYRHQPSTLNTFNLNEGKLSTFSISLWLFTDSISNLQFICQEPVLFLVGLTGFTMKYQSYCLSGVTILMTVGTVREWLYSQPFCYSSPSPGTLADCSILYQRNEYAKTYKCPKEHKAMCVN